VTPSTHLAFVGDRCCDHSPSSGYDQVCTLFEAAGWLSGRALEGGETRWIRAPSVAADPTLVHVFYGDCSGAAAVPLVRERWPDATIVLTVHQPVARMRRDRAAMHALAFADAILTVSEVQARELTALLHAGVPVRAVPHGVWPQAFTPDAADRVRMEALLVGNYLRDWRATERIADLLARRGVRCRLVGTNAPRERFADHPTITVTPPLSEPELAATYDESAAMLMPVLDATASNALLEAMSAGCPVVCSAVPSLVDEYIGDRVDAFEDGDDEAAVGHLLRYVADPDSRTARSEMLRARAQRFDWRVLASQYAAAYAELDATPTAVALARRP
jgi:glycosyltransferase involved in cell wall biosynthesis